MKKTKSNNNQLSPEQYIRQRLRSLEIGTCYMNRNWNVTGKALAIITRKHKQGTITAGLFFIDTFCLGIRESSYYFSISQEEFNGLINQFKINMNIPIEVATYQEIHNLIYGVIEFAEEGGITPAPSFNTTRFFLEEDTDDIPLIRYWYGKEGKHLLIANSRQELDKFMPFLIGHLGANNVYFTSIYSKKIYNGTEYVDGKTAKDIQNLFSKIVPPKKVELEKYTYSNNNYPKELNIMNKNVYEILTDPKNNCNLSEDIIKELMALPHEELKADLENIIMYEIGQTHDDISEEELNEEPQSVILHCVILLGELGYESSLPVILELLSQNEKFINFHFGFLLNEVFVPTIYLLGKNKLDELMKFMKTPGLYTYAKYLVSPAVALIAKKEPQRREEIISWYKELLTFYSEKLKDNVCCDGTLIGLISVDIKKLNGVELLPELKTLYDTGMVDESCCGSYEKIESTISKNDGYSINYSLNINDRYKAFNN